MYQIIKSGKNDETVVSETKGQKILQHWDARMEEQPSWVCDMTFSAKFSALGVSVIPSYPFNFTYLGYSCPDCFYKLKLSIHRLKANRSWSAFPFSGKEPGYEWIDKEAGCRNTSQLQRCRISRQFKLCGGF